MKRSRLISILAVLVVLVLYQAPNLALLAYKGGLPIADTKGLAVEIEVTNGWYPVASSDSLVGKALLPTAGPRLVAFQRPSLIWPWRGELFAVMAYQKPIDASAVELVKQARWGQAMLLKPNSTSDAGQRLFAVPDYGVGILANDQQVLDDIVMIRKSPGQKS